MEATTKKVWCGPRYPARAPPMAGPATVPALKAAPRGAVVEARLRGVEMSVAARVEPVTRKATPQPVTARAAASVSNPSASPTPAKPSETSERPPTMQALRPWESTKAAAGMFETSLAPPKAETTRPYWVSLSARSCTKAGMTGITAPTESPPKSIVAAMGQMRGSRSEASSTTRRSNVSNEMASSSGLSSCVHAVAVRGSSSEAHVRPTIVAASADRSSSRLNTPSESTSASSNRDRSSDDENDDSRSAANSEALSADETPIEFVSPIDNVHARDETTTRRARITPRRVAPLRAARCAAANITSA
mmetsp:Transcript_9618/g.30812  ORF Transcript_9618/g.30812 Transcript_9618/m.30812 type:complete len:306 (+) Transcript_9618:677-1594(+)